MLFIIFFNPFSKFIHLTSFFLYFLVLLSYLYLSNQLFIKSKNNENFTVYEIDYGTGIGPWWAQGAGLNRGYHRCICSGTGNCRCINDLQFEDNPYYPQYYYN